MNMRTLFDDLPTAMETDCGAATVSAGAAVATATTKEPSEKRTTRADRARHQLRSTAGSAPAMTSKRSAERGSAAPRLAPVRSTPPFELELRRLVRARLAGDIDFEAFCRANLELHFRYGRPGYDRSQFEEDLQEHRERERRAARRENLDRTLQGLPIHLRAVPRDLSGDGGDVDPTTHDPRGPRAIGA